MSGGEGRTPPYWHFEGRLYGPDGERLVQFRDNEIRVCPDLWDIDFSRSQLVIRRAKGEILLRILFDAECGIITIDRLHMRLGGGHYIYVNEHRIEVTGPTVSCLLSTPQFDSRMKNIVLSTEADRERLTGNVFLPGAQLNLQIYSIGTRRSYYSGSSCPSEAASR